MTLHEYIQAHCERGACQCGNCIDAPGDPAEQQPVGHTADLIFFKVRATGDPTAEELTAAIKAHGDGGYGIDLFDGSEHNYLEVGALVGDQGMGMMLMGLGSLLGLWQLLTPRTMLFADMPDNMALHLAGQGMIAVQSVTHEQD